MRYIIIHLFLMTLTHQHESYIIKVNKSKLVKYGLDSILQKYLNPMRRLTEDLPNHNVEVQLEIVGSIPEISAVEPQRRRMRFFKQPARRYNMESGMSSPMPITTTESIETTTTVSTTLPTSTIITTTINIGKQPVYMDDLKKALDEFEKKLSTEPTTTSTTADSNNPPFLLSRKPYLFTRPSTALQYPIDRNIHGLVRLLRSGVNLESPVALPTNENLEWLKVKIPKNA